MKWHNLEEEVVVSGIGCKLPECDNIDEFAEKLFAGQNLVTQDDRKLSQGLFENLPEYSGKARETRKFDYTFFGISNIAAQCMDPMTQQILERTFEAVIDAGLNPSELRGTDTAVFSGTAFSDFDLEWASNYKGGYGIMGRNRCMNANRVSYWLDLKGTSVSMDTNWANGMNALVAAWNSIRKGYCDTAIVSTANIQSTAEVSIQLNDMGVLSAEGVCKPFDDTASGYTRSDAIVVLILQRASIARRSYGTIVHACGRCFGDKEKAIKLPVQEHWEELFHEVYTQSSIDVNDICYVEGHAQGIKEEDAVEMKAVSSFFCKNRKTPLLIGSVKSNMGHSEASAACCSLVKSLILLDRGIIPQNLHFTTPNSQVCHAFQSGKLKVVDQNTPLPENGLIALNSHGFGGVYGHIVLKHNPKPKTTRFDGIPRLLLVAGRTNEFMENVLAKLEAMPFDAEYVALLNMINSKKLDKYLGRGYTILPKKEGAPSHDHQEYNEMKRPVWFIFSGMGSQWPTMGKKLMTLPIFRESIEKCHKILEPRGLDLIKIITDDNPKMFDNILHSFVGIAAIQIALVDILTALKIEPDGMIGHSVGELGCAYADGCFTAEQMILSAYSRGRASLESNLIKGYMAAVGMGYSQIKDELPEGIEVACHNAADSCTISGPADAVQEYVKELEKRGIFAKTVNVSNIAYHSKHIRPAAPKLLKYLKEVIPSPKLRSSRWISTSNVEEAWDTELARYCSAEYHTNNLLSSVLFEEGCRHIPSKAICIEIAPHGLLQAILKRSLGENCTNISLTRRTAEDPLNFLLQSIGKLFMAGLEPQVMNIYPPVEFPVSRGTHSIHQMVGWEHGVDLVMQQNRSEKKVVYSIKNELLKTAPDGMGYIINGENSYPVATFLSLVWSIFAMNKKLKIDDCPVLFENIRIESPMVIHPSKNDEGMISLQKGTGVFEITTTQLLIRGNISLLSESNLKSLENEFSTSVSFDTSYTMSKDEIYNEFQSKGYDVGENLKSLTAMSFGNRGWTGEIDRETNWVQAIESAFQVQVLHMGEDSEFPKFPKSFEKMYIIPQYHFRHKASLEEEKKKLVVSYDIVQNVTRCGGIKLKGLQTQELPLSKSALKFMNKQFAPFMNPQLKDAWQYADFCMGIVIDNIQPFTTEIDVNILEVEDETRGIFIGKYLEETYSYLKLKIQRVTPGKDVEEKSFDLIICPIADLEKYSSSASDSGLILARLLKNQAVKAFSGMEVVSRFGVTNNEELILLKKVDTKAEPEFIQVPKNEALLVNVLHGLTEVNHPVYLVVFGEPERGMENFRKRVQTETSVPLRWILILDEDSGLNEQSNYRNYIKNGLVTNVFKNGTWGFFLQHNYTEKQLDLDLFSVKKLNDDMSEYHLGFDFTRNFIELKQVEFSGKLKNNTRIMGVGSVLDDASIVRENYLSWNLPDSWSLEDGATVPLAYVYAYYCTVLIGNLKNYESLLVTDACTPLGMAAVHVGLSMVPKVVVTVADETEAVVIRNRFPSIPPEDIIYHGDKNFHVELGVRTKGKNPEMIINQLEGEKLMSTCSCLCSYGRIFHFGADDYKKNSQLGTYIFLLSTSFYSMSQDVILNMRDEEKAAIRDLIEKGLKDGIVKPLPRKIFTLRQFQRLVGEGDSIPRKEKPVLALGALKNACQNKLQIDSDCSYLIIGDDTEVWIDVMRCLVRNGARKIVISHLRHTKRTERHAKFIKKHNVIVHEEKNTRDIQSLINEAQKMGILQAVFVIAMKNETANKVLAEVDKTYRDRRGYLTIISKEDGPAGDLCARRNQSGFPSSNFIWTADEILIGREMELVRKLCGRDPIIHVSHASKGAFDDDSNDEMLREVLPSSIQEFCNFGASLNQEVRITEMPNHGGCRQATPKEISPMFFIGGLQNDPVEMILPLAKNLFYPSYCIHLPNMNLSIKQMVSFILPKIYDLKQESNVFNIVGISWGCFVAIEVAKQIEGMGGSVGLILVHCPHHNLKLKLAGSKSWESDFLKIISGFSKTIQSDFHALDKTWHMKLNRIIANLNLNEEDEKNFREAANFMRNGLSALVNYDIAGVKLLGPLTVLKSESQSFDDRTISRLCNCISVRSVPGTVRDVLNSKFLREIINGSAVSKSMSDNTVHQCSWRELDDFIVQQRLSDFNSIRTDFRLNEEFKAKVEFEDAHEGLTHSLQ